MVEGEQTAAESFDARGRSCIFGIAPSSNKNVRIIYRRIVGKPHSLINHLI